MKNLLKRPLDLDPETMALYGEAMLALGKLNEMAHKVPDMQRFIKAYVIKEALLSSSIEGIHTTLYDIYTQPLFDTKPNKNTQLVMNYTKALNVALNMIKKDGLPIVSRVILGAHKALMQVGEGDKANPGNYRKLSVKVGNLVPAPGKEVPQLMSKLEQYINTNESLPPLIKAGLAHVQFETIHPFLDGNGRIGRLLIILILIEHDLLSEPILYPSYYFKKHHHQYYYKLDAVRTKGDFEGWIKFYLNAIKESSQDAYQRAKDIEDLQEKLKLQITNNITSQKMLTTRLQALMILFNYPIISINELSVQLDVSYNTAHQIITELIALDILVPQTKQKRGKLFKFKKYWEILERD